LAHASPALRSGFRSDGSAIATKNPDDQHRHEQLDQRELLLVIVSLARHAGQISFDGT
jgi:hypothetical protein